MGKNKWTIFIVLLSLLLVSCAGQGGELATARATALIPQSAGPTETQPSAEQPTETQAVEPSPSKPETPSPAQTGAEPLTTEIAAPQCIALAEHTPPMTEGPYYTPGSPEETNLYRDGIPGQRLLLTGVVLNAECQPVSGARVDFWQADGQGVYDNSGYTLRGHQITGPDGGYRLETVLPGEYPGRTPHIHVKVTAPGGPELTTQVFFPGMAGNQTDRIFDDRLVVTPLDPPGSNPEVLRAAFNFIVTE